MSYVIHRTLNGHTQPINALRFSPDGQLLASGASDSSLRVWSSKTGKCVQSISTTVHSSVTDLVWATNQHGDLAIIFSCADGTVHIYVRSVKEPDSMFEGVIVIGAHSFAIEGLNIDLAQKRLATTGGGEVKVWSLTSDWNLDLHASAPARATSVSRTVHFINKGRYLLATYLDSSKIVAWNIDPWKKLWEMKVDTPIAAISPDELHVLIHNFSNGTDAYGFPNMNKIATFHAPVDIRKPKQVVFDPSGTLVIQGSDKGIVYISNFRTAMPTQSLVHSTGKRPPYPSNDHAYDEADSEQDALVPVVTCHTHGEQHWIASGCATEHPVIKIWKRKQSTSEEKSAAVFLVVGICLAIAVQYFALWDRIVQILEEISDRIHRK